MTEIVSGNIEQGKVIAVNKYCDIGALLLEDCQSYGTDKTEKWIQDETRKNVCALYRELFELKKQQKMAEGEDGEILEYTKSTYQVSLPEPKIILPREKPIPKEKPLTKWEKFRKERGLQERQKRSRLVFDPITNDWVPRWGHNSQKKIAEAHDWLIEDKPKHDDIDPFTLKRQEKKLQLEKEKMKQIKNEIRAIKTVNGKNALNPDKILAKQEKKEEDVAHKEQVKKRERKALQKSFQLAQLSTASMGKFDRKVGKNEPDAPNSQKILKKKSNSQLAKLDHDHKGEKDRNMKILSWMQKADEVKGHSKAESHLDVDRLVNRQIRKEERRRKKANIERP